jgi:hypothetical protein
MNVTDWSREALGCSLTDEEFQERIRFIHSLTDRALIAREPQPGGMLFRFRPGPDNESAIRELVALESQCCPNLRFDVEASEDEIRLGVREIA